MATSRTIRNMVTKQPPRVLTLDKLNPDLSSLATILDSKMNQKLDKYKKDEKKGIPPPFDTLLRTNIGDPQSVGQSPITYLRQLLATCMYPQLIDSKTIPEDVKSRAKLLLQHMTRPNDRVIRPRGSTIIREHISTYIGDRDGTSPPNPKHIILSEFYFILKSLFKAVESELHLPFGVLLPIPTYPTYIILLESCGLVPLLYYLDDEKEWELNVEQLKRIIDKARHYSIPKALIVVNPGNPTANVLEQQNIEDMIKLCYNENLFIITDEDYQNSIWDPKTKFLSLRKVKNAMPFPFITVDLMSIHSASKEFIAECGLRGGYVEFDDVTEDVMHAFTKALSLCGDANVGGQIAMDVIVKPPCENDPSWELFNEEHEQITKSYSSKAAMLTETINEIDGIHMNVLKGGLFAYPRIMDMPQNAVKKAAELGMDPSELWSIELLERTGVVVVPGNYFKQIENRYYFRVAIVSSEEILAKICLKIKEFHKDFLKRYK